MREMELNINTSIELSSLVEYDIAANDRDVACITELYIYTYIFIHIYKDYGKHGYIHIHTRINLVGISNICCLKIFINV